MNKLEGSYGEGVDKMLVTNNVDKMQIIRYVQLSLSSNCVNN